MWEFHRQPSRIGRKLLGRAGEDYPKFPVVPSTTFKCTQNKPGYYADVDALCQVCLISFVNVMPLILIEHCTNWFRSAILMTKSYTLSLEHRCSMSARSMDVTTVSFAPTERCSIKITSVRSMIVLLHHNVQHVTKVTN